MSYGEDPRLKNSLAFKDKTLQSEALEAPASAPRAINYLPHEVWTSRKGSEQIVDKLNEVIRRLNRVCGFAETDALIEMVRRSE